MRTVRYKDTCEILVSEGLLVPADIEAARTQSAETGESTIESLLRETPLSEADLARCLSAQHQLPMIPLSLYQLDGDLLQALEADFVWEHGLLPLSRIGAAVIIAAAEVPPAPAIATLRERLHAEPFFTISYLDEIQLEITRGLGFSDEQKISIDQRVRTHRRGGCAPERGSETTGVSSTSSLLEALDDSWENIFEEAEKNVRDGSL